MKMTTVPESRHWRRNQEAKDTQRHHCKDDEVRGHTRNAHKTNHPRKHNNETQSEDGPSHQSHTNHRISTTLGTPRPPTHQPLRTASSYNYSNGRAHGSNHTTTTTMHAATTTTRIKTQPPEIQTAKPNDDEHDDEHQHNIRTTEVQRTQPTTRHPQQPPPLTAPHSNNHRHPNNHRHRINPRSSQPPFLLVTLLPATPLLFLHLTTTQIPLSLWLGTPYQTAKLLLRRYVWRVAARSWEPNQAKPQEGSPAFTEI
jgi:hypothetical protein